jgi:hypothetical protein
MTRAYLSAEVPIEMNPVKTIQRTNLEKGLFYEEEGLIMISGSERDVLREQCPEPAVLKAEIKEFGATITMLGFPKLASAYGHPVIPQDAMGFCFRKNIDSQYVLLAAIADGVTNFANLYINESAQYADRIVREISNADLEFDIGRELYMAGNSIEQEHKPLQTGTTTAQWLKLTRENGMSHIQTSTVGHRSDVPEILIRAGGKLEQITNENKFGFIGQKHCWATDLKGFSIKPPFEIILRTDGFPNSIIPGFAEFISEYPGANFFDYAKQHPNEDDASMILIEME